MEQKENIALRCQELIRRGYDFGQIAKTLKMPKSELMRLSRQNEELATVLRVVTDKIDNQVEEALLRRALGYSSVEVYCEDLIDKKSGEPLEVVKRRTVTKQVAPDVRAAMVWLENRRPMRWKNVFIEPDLPKEIELDPEDMCLL